MKHFEVLHRNMYETSSLENGVDQKGRMKKK